MIKVQVRPNEPVEAALRRFKRQCNYAGIFRLAKKHAYFEKRSDKKRREERERMRSLQRALRKQQDRGRSRPRRKSKGRGDAGDDGDAGDEMVSAVDKPSVGAAAARDDS